MGTANTFQSMKPNMKETYSDGCEPKDMPKQSKKKKKFKLFEKMKK